MGGSRNTTPLHGLAAVSAGLPDQLPMPGRCRSRPHDSGGVRYTRRLQSADHCAGRAMIIVTQHDFAAYPRTRGGPVKFSTRHRGYPVGFLTV